MSTKPIATSEYMTPDSSPPTSTSMKNETSKSPTGSALRVSMRHAEIGVDDGLIGLHLRGRPFCDLASVIEDRDAVGQAHHEADVVLDEDDRRAETTTNRADELRHLRLVLHGHAGERLVEEEEVRLGDCSAREFDALLNAVRQRADQAIAIGLQVKQIERFVGPAARLGYFGTGAADPQNLLEDGGPRRKGQASRDVVEGREPLEKPEFRNVRATPRAASRDVGERV